MMQSRTDNSVSNVNYRPRNVSAPRNHPHGMTFGGAALLAMLIATNLSRFSIVALVAVGFALLAIYIGMLQPGGNIFLVTPVLAFVSMWLLSAFAVGTLPFQTHSSWLQWLNNDGRTLSAYLPLLVGGSYTLSTADRVWFARATVVAIWGNCILALTDPFSPGYSGLTSSHHVPGYIAGASLIVMLSHWRTPRPVGIRVSMGAAVVVLLLSGSRTSIVGLAAVAAFYVARRVTLTQTLRATGMIACLSLFALIDTRVRDTATTLLSGTFWTSATRAFSTGFAEQSVVYFPPQAGVPSYVANMVSRFFYWGNALGFWGRSPFVGIGSGRYNDLGLQYSGIPGLAEFATKGVSTTSEVIGAHNQYLGILAENGLIGLAAMLAIWWRCYRGANDSSRPFEAGRSGGLDASYLVIFALGTALTGYTLVSPSLTFIALSWLSLAFAARVNQEEDIESSRRLLSSAPTMK